MRNTKALIQAGYRALKAIDFPLRGQKTTVFDCWRLLRDELSDCAWVDYVPLGFGRPKRERQILQKKPEDGQWVTTGVAPFSSRSIA